MQGFGWAGRIEHRETTEPVEEKTRGGIYKGRSSAGLVPILGKPPRVGRLMVGGETLKKLILYLGMYSLSKSTKSHRIDAEHSTPTPQHHCGYSTWRKTQREAQSY